MYHSGTSKPRVVVLGSGWGAISFIKSLPRNVACAPACLSLQFQTKQVLQSGCNMGRAALLHAEFLA